MQERRARSSFACVPQQTGLGPSRAQMGPSTGRRQHTMAQSRSSPAQTTRFNAHCVSVCAGLLLSGCQAAPVHLWRLLATGTVPTLQSCEQGGSWKGVRVWLKMQVRAEARCGFVLLSSQPGQLFRHGQHHPSQYKVTPCSKPAARVNTRTFAVAFAAISEELHDRNEQGDHDRRSSQRNPHAPVERLSKRPGAALLYMARRHDLEAALSDRACTCRGKVCGGWGAWRTHVTCLRSAHNARLCHMGLHLL